MSNKVRVRFAPSPTGGLHIGGLRTALYNFLYARKLGGKMVLRIEDTDRSRFVDGAEDYIRESLVWCGIVPDESPWEVGEYGPYRQSERLGLYQKYANDLVNQGKAYYAFDTPEELEDMRQKLKNDKASFQQYGIESRMTMRNSLSLSQDETAGLLNDNMPYVIRLKVPEGVSITITDKIRGEVSVLSDTIDDKIIMKSDGFPTYHLANVVDDYLMKITHVIRGEEWLPSAPLHALLYRQFGWEESMPEFAHLPLLLKPEGNGKLSKRDAEKHGFPIFPLSWSVPGSSNKVIGFKETGYLADALVNFLALLGWNPGTEEEIFSMDELISQFSLERINKSGAKFDINKATWFNEHYLRTKPQAELTRIFIDEARGKGHDCPEEMANKIIRLLIDRVSFPNDFWNLGEVFFVSPTMYDSKLVSKKWNIQASQVLTLFATQLTDHMVKDVDKSKQLLWQIADSKGLGLGKVMPALRIAITGGGGGPDLLGMISILGTSETGQRIAKARTTLD